MLYESIKRGRRHSHRDSVGEGVGMSRGDMPKGWRKRESVHTYSALMDEAPRNEVITLAAIITNPFENGNASISCAS
jgi:hypothetical protein